jgi:hypothetical protein
MHDIETPALRPQPRDPSPPPPLRRNHTASTESYSCAPWKPLFFRGIHKIFRAQSCAMSNLEQIVAQ